MDGAGDLGLTREDSEWSAGMQLTGSDSVRR